MQSKNGLFNADGGATKSLLKQLDHLAAEVEALPKLDAKIGRLTEAMERLSRIGLLIRHAPTAIVHRIRELAELDGKLAALEGVTCTGKVTWRDANGDKPAKMLIIHGTGQDCPIHGKAKGKKRIRTYIGTDLGKQSGAEHAITSEERRVKLQAERNSLDRCIQTAVRLLEEFYTELGYSYPSEGHTEAPEPQKGWEMRRRYTRRY